MTKNLSGSKRPAARRRIERSVFLSQLVLAGATLLLVAVLVVVQPAMLSEPLYFFGVVIIFFTTGLAAALPWRRIPKGWIVVLPILDIFAIELIRESQPLLGVTFLLVFPVIWMSTHFGGRGATGGVIVATFLLWGGVAIRGMPVPTDEIPRLAVVPIMLAFVATITYSTTRLSAAQRVLLRQQSGLFEAALQRSRRQEQTLDEIFNAVDFGVVGFDRAGMLTFTNRAQREMLARFGVRAGQPAPDVVYQEDGVTPYAEADRPFQRARRGETVDRVTMWVGEPGQDRVALLVSTRSVLDDLGLCDGGVMVVRDVTAEIRAIKARDDLVASVSHELRTPLTSILGYLELSLDDDRLDPETRRMLEVASKNADRLLVLLADLLTAASDSKYVLSLAFAPCDLSTIVTDAVESLRPVAAEQEITFELGSLPPVELEADALRLRQVVDNLLSNAIKYNVLSGRIAVSLNSTDATAELRVADTGRGMTDEEQKRLFDRFYRADSVRGSSVHGTGLGLSISRDIMRQHGGDLRLESTRGKGTTAIATLPRRR